MVVGWNVEDCGYVWGVLWVDGYFMVGLFGFEFCEGRVGESVVGRSVVLGWGGCGFFVINCGLCVVYYVLVVMIFYEDDLKLCLFNLVFCGERLLRFFFGGSLLCWFLFFLVWCWEFILVLWWFLCIRWVLFCFLKFSVDVLWVLVCRVIKLIVGILISRLSCLRVVFLFERFFLRRVGWMKRCWCYCCLFGRFFFICCCSCDVLWIGFILRFMRLRVRCFLSVMLVWCFEVLMCCLFEVLIWFVLVFVVWIWSMLCILLIIFLMFMFGVCWNFF